MVAAGPPPSTKTSVKLVAQSMKISPATPGTTRASAGHSTKRKIEAGFMPRLADRSQYSAGSRSSTESSRRTASGMLKNV
ncbi:hypothetical protein D3C71_1907660 [compost metagenome]